MGEACTALDNSAQRRAFAPVRARHHPGEKGCDRCCQREAARKIVGRLRDPEPAQRVERLIEGLAGEASRGGGERGF